MHSCLHACHSINIGRNGNERREIRTALLTKPATASEPLLFSGSPMSSSIKNSWCWPNPATSTALTIIYHSINLAHNCTFTSKLLFVQHEVVCRCKENCGCKRSEQQRLQARRASCRMSRYGISAANNSGSNLAYS